MHSCSGILVVITFLCPFVSASDTEVSCVYMQSCVLPCTFQVGEKINIHYFYSDQGLCVYSLHKNQDELDQQFRGRTSLFQDQISRGNASLLLRGVKVQDEGRYRCYTSTGDTNKNSYIILKVDTEAKVHMSQEGNWITCSSEGIYPEPGLTWSTIPPSNLTLQNRTRVHQTEDQLYSISSSLMVPDEASDLIYSCTVTTQRNQRRATVRRLTSSSAEATIPCSSSNHSLTNLTWRFNHSQVILTKTDSSRVSEVWRKYVKEVSESGSLTLQDLSPQHEGVYTCDVSDEEETNTLLKLNQVPENPVGVGVIVGVLVVLTAAAAAAAATAAAVGFLLCRRQKQREELTNKEEIQLKKLKSWESSKKDFVKFTTEKKETGSPLIVK